MQVRHVQTCWSWDQGLAALGVHDASLRIYCSPKTHNLQHESGVARTYSSYNFSATH